MKRFAVLIAATALMGVFAFEALAASPHFKGRSPISFTDNGLTLSATASYEVWGTSTPCRS